MGYLPIFKCSAIFVYLLNRVISAPVISSSGGLGWFCMAYRGFVDRCWINRKEALSQHGSVGTLMVLSALNPLSYPASLFPLLPLFFILPVSSLLCLILSVSSPLLSSNFLSSSFPFTPMAFFLSDSSTVFPSSHPPHPALSWQPHAVTCVSMSFFTLTL